MIRTNDISAAGSPPSIPTLQNVTQTGNTSTNSIELIGGSFLQVNTNANNKTWYLDSAILSTENNFGIIKQLIFGPALASTLARTPDDVGDIVINHSGKFSGASVGGLVTSKLSIPHGMVGGRKPQVAFITAMDLPTATNLVNYYIGVINTVNIVVDVNVAGGTIFNVMWVAIL
jgi:hypothetical protein